MLVVASQVATAATAVPACQASFTYRQSAPYVASTTIDRRAIQRVIDSFRNRMSAKQFGAFQALAGSERLGGSGVVRFYRTF
jgi:hypothetical protein